VPVGSALIQKTIRRIIWMMTLVSAQELILALALFFNPFGYNELFAFIMTLTGSYWITSLIFYLIAGSLFGTFLLMKRRSNAKIQCERNIL
jgi:hypothetical protein